LPPQPEAFAVSGSTRSSLTDELPAVLPSGPLTLEVREVPHASAVRLDGRPLAVAFDLPTRVATVAINLDRATGFHLLQVGEDRQYLFGTEDAKLRIDGVVEMLAYLRDQTETLGLAWNGTLQFSGSNKVLRDIRLDYAWLERNVGEVVGIARSISRRPFAIRQKRLERAQDGHPDVAATARLVRRRPDLMEPHPDGPVDVDGQRWAPRQFLRPQHERATDTPGNRTVTRLLIAMLELARLCEASAPPDLQAAVATHTAAIAAAVRLEPFASIRRMKGHLRVAAHPRREERTDERYRRARAILQELLRGRHWDPRQQLSQEWAFAALADQVYQAFTAIVLARAFELEAAAPLGATGPHFSSVHYEMWVDAVPPREILHNWRDDTSTPAAFRPDLVLRRKVDGHVALLDAKYRSAGERATAGSLAEVQLYLQAFGCRQVCVLFPPITGTAPWQPNVVTNGHFSLIELPLRPMEDLDHYATATLRPAIERSFHAPSAQTVDAAEAAREEAVASTAQAAAVRTLVAGGEVVRLTQPTLMLAAENNLRRLLAAVWPTLADDIHKMLITAEFFGDQVPVGFDHSGPVLGLFAACERLSRDRLFTPADAVLGGLFRRVTYGEAAETLRRLPYWRGGREESLRRWASEQPGVDIQALGRCGKAMLAVNRWRIAAAHSVLVDKATWDNTHTIVLDRQKGLLVQLCAALPDPP
jgi:hypothetical protein